MRKVDVEFFRELLHGIAATVDELDACYGKYLDRTLDELDPVSRALLRLGTYELLHRIDVPYRVAINEGINLAKAFGPTDAHKYVNSILDKVAAGSRQLEIAARAHAVRSGKLKHAAVKLVLHVERWLPRGLPACV